MIDSRIPWEVYKTRKEMNPSTLKHGVRSMKRLKRAINRELEPDRKNVIVGNAVHCMISGEYDERYRVMPAYELDPLNVTKTGKPSTSKSTEFYQSSAANFRALLEDTGQEEITEVEAATAAKIANKIREKFGSVIDNSEQEVTVTGEIEGVPMRTRLDGLCGDKVWDLKTTADADDFAFYRVLKRLGYGFSAAVHCELLAQNGITVMDYAICVAEDNGDYDVRIVRVPILYLEQQLATVRRVAREYRLAMEKDVWPGLGDSELVIPNWDMVEEEELPWAS